MGSLTGVKCFMVYVFGDLPQGYGKHDTVALASVLRRLRFERDEAIVLLRNVALSFYVDADRVVPAALVRIEAKTWEAVQRAAKGES